MIKLPGVKDLPIANKRVLLRTNYDAPLKKAQSAKRKVQKWEVADQTRIEESLPTIKYLLGQKAKIIIISHLGRPKGKVIPELSLKPVVRSLNAFLRFKKEIPLIQAFDKTVINHRFVNGVVVLENLRFHLGEEENDLDFAKNLASLGDFFVNDAFACSHRRHASIVGIPQFLPSAFGFDFLKEIEVLTKVRENPKRPVVVVLGGVKEDKLEAVGSLTTWADYVLVGGKLPSIITNFKFQISNEKLIIGALNPDGKDITLETVEKFKQIISQAKTIIWAGPMGIFEDKRFEKGTKEIARAIVESGAFSVVGGGDTEAALTKFGLTKRISFISSGGGAMLEFLAKGTLPGIEAILKQ